MNNWYIYLWADLSNDDRYASASSCISTDWYSSNNHLCISSKHVIHDTYGLNIVRAIDAKIRNVNGLNFGSLCGFDAWIVQIFGGLFFTYGWKCYLRDF